MSAELAREAGGSVVSGVTVTEAQRRTNSSSGNPRYTLVTDRGDFHTKDDAAINNVILNLVDGSTQPMVDLIINGQQEVVYVVRDGVRFTS